MGRTCKVCGRLRRNEKFGGRGLRRVICSDCRKLPKAERTRILVTKEVYHFLEQSNISKKNIKRLESLTTIEDESFQRLRGLVLEIAKAKPHKRRRWKFLRKEHPDLIQRAADSGFFNFLDVTLFENFDAPENWPLIGEYLGDDLDNLEYEMLEDWEY